MRITRRAVVGLMVVAVCACMAACGSGAAQQGAPATPASASPTGKLPVDGPSAAGPATPRTATAGAAADAACRDALQAEQALQASQGKDESNRGALDQDFTTFANRLAADAQKETNPTAAQAMTSLSNDYTDLVESQTGGAQLPGMTTVQDDGAAFDQACEG